MAGKGTSQFIRKLVGVVAGAGLGIVIGIAFTRLLGSDAIAQMSAGTFAVTWGLLVVLVFLAVYLQFVIHEAGHLVFGLATGYRFSSFRVGSLMLVREGGRLRLKRLSIPGTGGQCLMVPPGSYGEPYPCVLYNLGGIIANLASALACALLLPGARGNILLSGFLASSALVGVAMALVNGIPMRGSEVPNDGWNALNLGHNELARTSLWVQLTAGARLNEGERLQDLPDEWFVEPTDEQLSNTISLSLGVLSESRLMEQHELERARQLADRLLLGGKNLPGIYRVTLACDKASCDLILDGDADISALEGEDAALYKQLGNYPSVLRTRYAIALLKHGDATEAADVRTRFERVARSYPTPADIIAERDLMALVDQAAATSDQ